MKRIVAALLVLIGLGAGRAARAEDPNVERARIHVRAAIAYYDAGRYEDAAHEMQAAYELKPLPDLQYNLAQCYERLDKLEEAAQAYEKYLAGRADAPDRHMVQQRIANLRERARAEAAGKKPPPPATKEKVVFKTLIVYREAPPPPGRAARWAAYGLGVLGLGGLAVGIAYAVLAQQAADTVTKGGNPMNPMSFETVSSVQDSGKTYPIISAVSFAIGGVACAGAVALWLVARKVDREAPKLTLGPSFGPSGGGLYVAGRF